jgi:prepilin-type N-terminal cleavage/methylation domain-containing protein
VTRGLRLVRRWTDSNGVRDERGFTLIELLIVVFIISLLAVLALPTFLGTRVRAWDRTTQADVRNAFAAEKAYYTDTLTYTEVPAQMTAIEAAITYLAGDTPATTDVVYLHVHPGPNELYLSAMSESGTCWYLREVDGGGAEFASDPACGIADLQVYSRTAWN